MLELGRDQTQVQPDLKLEINISLTQIGHQDLSRLFDGQAVPFLDLDR